MSDRPKPDWTWNKWKFIVFAVGILFWVLVVLLIVHFV